MGLLDRLRGSRVGGSRVTATWPAGQGRPAWMRDGMMVTLYEGSSDLEVVGESHHQRELHALAGGSVERVRVPKHAILVPETGNAHDDQAVAVWIAGLPVGHLRREDAVALRPGILALVSRTGQAVALNAVIVGGGPRGGGREGLLGVWLSYDPADFGLKRPAASTSGSAGLRTGLSAALMTDEADDSYDLSWLESLPTQPSKRVPRLKDLLQAERDPVSRHYIYAALEADLYAMRDLHPGMLEEYDQVAATHDQEMPTIREALLQKFAKLPLLETYKQAAIRNSKAGRIDAAIWWARRGVELYSDDAHDESWADDLRARIEKLEARNERLRAPRKKPAKPAAASNPSRPTSETLTCQTCGHRFERARTRGRKPHQCPECRSA